MFYEIKLKVEKENSKGEMKEVIEHFITDVGLFAEAEAKGLEQYVDCDVISITHSKVADLINEGFIKSYDQMITYLKNVYRHKYLPAVFS